MDKSGKAIRNDLQSQKAMEICLSALELEERSRAQFIAAETEGNPELRQMVEELLLGSLRSNALLGLDGGMAAKKGRPPTLSVVKPPRPPARGGGDGAVKGLLLKAAEIFIVALEMPEDDREAFLASESRGNPELRRILDQMMKEESLPAKSIAMPLLSQADQAAAREKDPLQTFRFSQGDVIGDYRIERPLGEGGFAVVYLARQLSLDRVVALKVSLDLGGEGRILAQLDHDNIVKAYSQSVDAQRNIRLIGMQYVEGATLAGVIEDWRQRRRLSANGTAILEFLNRGANSTVEQTGSKEAPRLLRLDYQEAVLWIGACLANALAYAHQRGVLHLDVKPSNVLLSRSGRPFLTDFNVSLDLRALRDGAATHFGGTLNYMAPEQILVMKSVEKREAIEKIDQRADIYSLGTVLKEFLAATVNSKANSQAASSPGRRAQNTLVLKELDRDPVKTRLGKDWSAVDTGIRQILAKCTAHHPDDRFESASTLAGALEGCLEMRDILKSLPTPGLWLRTAVRFPILFLSGSWLVPQLLAFVGATLFLAPETISFFNSDSAGISHPSVPLGGAGVWLVMAVLWFAKISHLARSTRYPLNAFENPAKTGASRRELLRLDQWTYRVVTCLWLPVNLLLFFWGKNESLLLSPFEIGRILLTCTLLGSTACAYSALLTQTLALRILYPRYWAGSSKIRQTATDEVSRIPRSWRRYYLAAAISPVLASLLLYLNRMGDPGQALRLSLCAAVLGLFGILFDFAVSHRVAQVVFAFRERNLGDGT